jgi:hypothetical protein
MTAIEIRYTDVLDVTGTSDHQLCHWARDGFIPGMPVWHGSGRRRSWTYDQIRHTRTLRLISEANPNLSRWMLRSISDRLAAAPWTIPFVEQVSTHVRMVVDLPTIDTEVTEALARVDPFAEVARTERRLRDAG